MKIFQILLFIAISAGSNAMPVASDDDRAEELENVFQGDMIISEEELRLYNGRIDENLRWKDNIVPYWINMTYFDDAQVAYIDKGAETLTNLTCLKFVRRTYETDFITISGDSTGCSSMVGRRGGSQLLKLKPAAVGTGCFRLFTIVHEFIHALGFHHMQSSFDRDEYVEIVWENINPANVNNFLLYGTETVTHFDVPYDYGSVMHYSKTSFSINGQDTIVPIQPLNGLVMGQRDKMSDKDISRIQRMYNCALVPHKIEQ